MTLVALAKATNHSIFHLLKKKPTMRKDLRTCINKTASDLLYFVCVVLGDANQAVTLQNKETSSARNKTDHRNRMFKYLDILITEEKQNL
jgi:hypothetical protein